MSPRKTNKSPFSWKDNGTVIFLFFARETYQKEKRDCGQNIVTTFIYFYFSVKKYTMLCAYTFIKYLSIGHHETGDNSTTGFLMNDRDDDHDARPCNKLCILCKISWYKILLDTTTHFKYSSVSRVGRINSERARLSVTKMDDRLKVHDTKRGTLSHFFWICPALFLFSSLLPVDYIMNWRRPRLHSKRHETFKTMSPYQKYVVFLAFPKE